MPPVCTLCRHPERAAIDQALVARQGGSLRDMARRWGVSKDAVARHRAHIPQALAKAVEAKAVAEADTLLARIEALASRAHVILTAAEQAKDWRACLVAIKTIADLLELIGKVSGELGKADREAGRADRGLAEAIREGRERVRRGRGATLEELVCGVVASRAAGGDATEPAAREAAPDMEDLDDPGDPDAALDLRPATPRSPRPYPSAGR